MRIARTGLVAMLVASLVAALAAATTPDLGVLARAPLTGQRPAASASGSAAGSSARDTHARTGRTRTAHARPGRAGRPAGDFDHREGRIVAAGAAATTAPDEAGDSPPPLHVLFIGNSHTRRFGGIDWLVANLVASEDPPQAIDAEHLTESAVTLEYHYRHAALQTIRGGDWDVVVLQEYVPGLATHSAEPFSTYAGLLDQAIRESGARTVLYMTWPDAANPWASLDDIVSAYERVGAEIDAPVAPVGVAMERAEVERPGLKFLGPDQVHTTWEGAYLAATTIYATIFGRSPEGLPYHFGISDDDASFLQRIAWETTRDWQAAAGHPFAETGTPSVAAGDQPTASDERPTG